MKQVLEVSVPASHFTLRGLLRLYDFGGELDLINNKVVFMTVETKQNGGE